MDFNIARDTAGLNQALFSVTHGLYILTSRAGDRINGQCLDSLMQVTNMPPRIAIGVGKRSLTHEMITESGVFVANVIDRGFAGCYDDVKRFGFQSGRKVDKFADRAQEPGEMGAPILPEAKAFYECRVISDKTLDLGTHTLFVADVIRAGTRESGEPLTYNEYRRVMKKK
ncbi:MAG: flavin reductase [Proteobacteria bacterium]|nr:flavin reductase [Pseudomonadota bacterium]